MVRVCDIYDVIHGAAPFDTALSFDNSGLLIGDGNQEVTRVLLALDITPAVVEEAAAMNANLILSHHPVIFHPVKSLGPQDVAYQLARNGIAALCCHTNLDLSPVCGVNVALGSKLGLKNVRREDVFGEECVLFSGELPEALAPEAFAALVKEKLGAPAVKFSPGEREVRKVFFCSGAGGEYLGLADCRGADAYLTGEMKHHEELEAARSRLTVVAAGHYHTEKVFAEFLASYLRKRIPGTAFLLSQGEAPPMGAL
ncbi:MAG TPA: Nif3-like dinuclear metal center hexameric protein [Candidatus Acutalibacter pullistercoris]|uniref:GTP cyclohydrolase 1 type 2 homolog n=1 Tax=Candidatus Acutalibacter pullistercoris TaxID=2838418 RepID=A0A9D1YAY0_9FIRM|nr:Nif3-like dinuclear metal center hexameric protein [Candidatus Acutalibacter pullistercoris]